MDRLTRIGYSALAGLALILGGQGAYNYVQETERTSFVRGHTQAKEFYENRNRNESVAPKWMQRYAQGFCDAKDVEYLAEHTEPSLGDYDAIKQVMDGRQAGGVLCDEPVRYLGNYEKEGNTLHIYVMSIGQDRNYWVFTTKDEKVSDIE